MPSGVLRHLCESFGLVRISSKPTLIGCPGEFMNRLDSCHIAHSSREHDDDGTHHDQAQRVEIGALAGRERESAMASGERDVEMADAEEFEVAMHGETEGDAFVETGEATAAETESYETAFHPGNLEALGRDIANEHEEREFQTDKAMRLDHRCDHIHIEGDLRRVRIERLGEPVAVGSVGHQDGKG